MNRHERILSCSRLSICAIAVSTLASCVSHVHNPRRAAIASKTLATVGEIDAAAPQLYTAMLANSAGLAAEEDRVVNEIATAASQAMINKFAVTGPDNFKSDVTALGGKIREFLETEVPLAAKDIAGETELAMRAAKDGAAAVKAAQKAITEKKAEITAFNQSIALIQSAIAQGPALAAKLAASSQGGDALASLTDVARVVEGTTISFVDADGMNQELDIAKTASALAKRFDRTGRFPRAPGIDLTVLNLVLDLAQFERDRARAELGYLSSRKQVFEDAVTTAEVSRNLLKEVPAGFTGARVLSGSSFAVALEANRLKSRASLAAAESSADRRDENSNSDIIGHLSSGNTSALAGQEMILAMRSFATAQAQFARSEALLKLKLARLQHERSIIQSSFADSQRRTLIKRASEGIAAYHASGLKPEHVGQIVGIAQVIALGAIAQN